jgi:hypothetical protein
LKLIISFLLIALFSVDANAQQNGKAVSVLSAETIQAIITDSVRKKFKILYPITKGYQYTDRSGQFIYLLTGGKDAIVDGNKANKQKIKAIVFNSNKRKLSKVFEINDNTIKNDHEEHSIWFWTEYIDFKDYDGDNELDPIIIYGSAGMNGTDDGRIKIITCYKGLKIAIRHQNGLLDTERETRVDKVFYSLPQKIQQAVKEKIELMIKDGNAIFPYGWQKAMSKKATFFSER